MLAGGEVGGGQVVDAPQRWGEGLAGGVDLPWFERVEGAASDVPGQLVAEGNGEAGEVPAGCVALVLVDESGAVVQEPHPVVPGEDVVHVADLLVAGPVAAGPHAGCAQHADGGSRAVLVTGHGQAAEPGLHKRSGAPGVGVGVG